MYARFSALRKHPRTATTSVMALTAFGFLAGCELSTDNPTPASLPSKVEPVTIAMLLPKTDENAAEVAVALENAARLALTELAGSEITLTVYDTAGDAQTAGQQAQLAVDAGADIILGPLYGEAANTAGLAVADEGVPVLSFSNNPAIAGGNVHILGATFADVADRLLNYAQSQSRQTVLPIYPNDIAGELGRLAIEQAAYKNGLGVITTEGYALSVEGVATAAETAGALVDTGLDTVFITAPASNAAVPMLLTMLPENGISPETVQYMALSRLDVRPDLFDLPAGEGIWFTLPDEATSQAFRDRYALAYETKPHPLAGLAYDGIALVAALQAEGDEITPISLTRTKGFFGSGGAFRLTAEGTNQRAMAVATVAEQQVQVLDPAPMTLGYDHTGS